MKWPNYWSFSFGIISSFSSCIRCKVKLFIWLFFPVSWGKPVLLWTCPLTLLLQGPIVLGWLCFHFYSFLVFFGRNDAKAETPGLCPPHAKSWLWCWEGLGAGGKGDNRGWDGWMASLTQWTWVWLNSRRWWWTGRPGVLQFIESQRVGHDSTELNWRA